MDIEKEIAEIKERNSRVENETSPWLKALVPGGAYILSTLSLPFIKSWWAKIV
ncbi:MAG: hypothetical protein UY65_C0030G0009 [Parcubacteria group bacterium GW2011_GWA2_51_12]|nr:MAG: hypothetical protein UY65_C0030G0009 [Parcubacteria group bacterium GW2011_GWA2_51_12]